MRRMAREEHDLSWLWRCEHCRQIQVNEVEILIWMERAMNVELMKSELRLLSQRRDH